MAKLILALCLSSAAALIAPTGSKFSTALKSDPAAFGQGPSLQWGGTDTTTSGAKKLSEALEDADIERKKAIEEVRRRSARFEPGTPGSRARAPPRASHVCLPDSPRPSAGPSGRRWSARRRCARSSS